MNENELKHGIKKSLDDLVENIDVTTQVKLNAARQAALEKNNFKKKTPVWSVVGMACAVVLMTSWFWNHSEVEHLPTKTDVPWLEDIDLLANEADPDFYQDLEFLAWLEATQLMDSDI